MQINPYEIQASQDADIEGIDSGRPRDDRAKVGHGAVRRRRTIAAALSRELHVLAAIARVLPNGGTGLAAQPRVDNVARSVGEW